MSETTKPERACRVCGCTDDNACLPPAGPCYWVEKDLCSACATPEAQAKAWERTFGTVQHPTGGMRPRYIDPDQELR